MVPDCKTNERTIVQNIKYVCTRKSLWSPQLLGLSHMGFGIKDTFLGGGGVHLHTHPVITALQAIAV